MGLCLLWQPDILLYIIVLYYVVVVWRDKFSSSSLPVYTELPAAARPYSETT